MTPRSLFWGGTLAIAAALCAAGVGAQSPASGSGISANAISDGVVKLGLIVDMLGPYGELTGKLPGRVGDSPIIGAGTYADNATCAVSATGHGEFFIRYAVAHEIAARIAHARQPLVEAAGSVVAELGRLGGSGGIIAIGRDGALALPFNCAGMYRGYVRDDGIVHTAIYDEGFTTT